MDCFALPDHSKGHCGSYYGGNTGSCLRDRMGNSLSVDNVLQMRDAADLACEVGLVVESQWRRGSSERGKGLVPLLSIHLHVGSTSRALTGLHCRAVCGIQIQPPLRSVKQKHGHAHSSNTLL